MNKTRKGPAKTVAPKAKKAIATAAPKAETVASERLLKVKAAFQQTKIFSKDNIDALTAAASAAAAGVKEVGGLGVEFAKARINSNLAAAQSLTNARSIVEVVDIQHAFAKGTIEAYTVEFGRLSQVVRSSLKGALSPLSSRANALYSTYAPARSA
jgi:hypothetical protein